VTQLKKIEFRDIFAKNSEEAIIKAIKNGLDPYLKILFADWYLSDDGYFINNLNYMTFFGDAVRYGTPGIVAACIEMGVDVNSVIPGTTSATTRKAETSALYAALDTFNVPTLRALLEHGADATVLGTLEFEVRRNIFPEASRDKRAMKFKHRLDEGVEVLKLLRDAGFCVSYSDVGVEMSFYGVKIDRSFYLGNDAGTEVINAEEEKEKTAEDLNLSAALWEAVSSEALRLMIDAGADVDRRDKYGWTAMHQIARRCGDFYFDPEEMMRRLIDAGADIETRDRSGMTPLMFAARRIGNRPKSLEMVKLLLRSGASLDAVDENGHDALYWITEGSWNKTDWSYLNRFTKRIFGELLFEIMRSVQAKADRAEGSENGNTWSDLPLSDEDIDLLTVSFWGRPKDIESALSRGANIEAKSQNGYTPIMFASAWNDARAVKHLIKRGADVEARNDTGETALILACIIGDPSYVGDSSKIRTLVKMGASLISTDNSGRTPLMAYIDSDGNKRTARFLIKSGADVNARDADGKTVLMYAVLGYFYDTVSFPDIGIVKAIIDAGASLNDLDNKGGSALDMLLDIDDGGPSRKEVARLLLARGADPAHVTAPTDVPPRDYFAEKLSEYGLIARGTFKEVFLANSQESLAAAVKGGIDRKSVV
jgi:ankyrin repeat protein